MTKDEIIGYVLNSPENTNPNILRGMLDQLDSGDDSKIPIVYQEDTIEFYFSREGEEFEDTFCIYEDISDNITQIFCEDLKEKGTFRLATKAVKVYLSPVDPFSYRKNQLCLIQEKEAWFFDSNNGDYFIVIKDSSGVVHGTKPVNAH